MEESTQAYENPIQPQWSRQDQSEGILRERLGTDDLYQRIQLFLLGKILRYELDQKTGQTKKIWDKIVEPRANEKGVYSILNEIQSVINKQVVQGFFDENEYADFIYRFHTNLRRKLWRNRAKWGIDDMETTNICDFIMNLVTPYMSRLKDNTERESYKGYTYNDTNQPNRSSGWSLWGARK